MKEVQCCTYVYGDTRELAENILESFQGQWDALFEHQLPGTVNCSPSCVIVNS